MLDGGANGSQPHSPRHAGLRGRQKQDVQLPQQQEPPISPADLWCGRQVRLCGQVVLGAWRQESGRTAPSRAVSPLLQESRRSRGIPLGYRTLAGVSDLPVYLSVYQSICVVLRARLRRGRRHRRLRLACARARARTPGHGAAANHLSRVPQQPRDPSGPARPFGNCSSAPRQSICKVRCTLWPSIAFLDRVKHLPCSMTLHPSLVKAQM